MDPEAAARPTLILNPAADANFRTVAEALVTGGVTSPEGLQAGLRRRFPDALVRPRELAGERVQAWYVYRDGHWIRSRS
jgi:hypothetical protein